MGAPISLVIRNLPNKVQTLNEMFSNSCQLANALVTNTKKYLEESPDLKSAMNATASSLTDDLPSVKSTKEDSPANRIVSAGEDVSFENTSSVV